MYERIVVPLDGSAEAEAALPVAEALARRPGAHVQLVHIVDPRVIAGLNLADTAALRTEQVCQADDYLSRIGAQLRTKGVAADWDVRLGDPPRALLRAIRDVEADLVIVVRRGAGRSDEAGSVAMKLLRQAACPAIMVPAPQT
ncbi:MAG TPA: universal stress protein [Dehalococcoidia bacterium]|nr:universal stress protein [Dehalococcoidia bacterium]